MLKTCEICDNNIKTNRNKYCSIECKNIALSTKINVICKQCSKQFLKLPNQIKRSENHFCSLSCHAKYRNSNKKIGNRRSKIEIMIEHELRNIFPNLKIEYNEKYAIKSELDIYIPELFLAFELNGVFHYKPIFGTDKLQKVKTNDEYKINTCKDKNIFLHQIDISNLKHIKNNKSIEPYLSKIINIINGHLKN